MSKKKNATVQAESTNEETTEQTTTEAAEVIQMVYIGPSIAFSKLRSSMILEGTAAEIDDYLAEYAEQYPEIKYLLVTPENLTDALDKVARKVTILHKYYEDTLAKVRASRT